MHTFLQSIIPPPVLSRSSFTSLALMPPASGACSRCQTSDIAPAYVRTNHPHTASGRAGFSTTSKASHLAHAYTFQGGNTPAQDLSQEQFLCPHGIMTRSHHLRTTHARRAVLRTSTSVHSTYRDTCAVVHCTANLATNKKQLPPCPRGVDFTVPHTLVRPRPSSE